MTRTKTYVMTVKLGDKNDMSRVAATRRIVKAINYYRKQDGQNPFYVKLQGRGYRYGVRRWNQSLPLSKSVTADVYVYERFPEYVY